MTATPSTPNRHWRRIVVTVAILVLGLGWAGGFGRVRINGLWGSGV
jgi:hypothetical protein